MSPLLSVLEFVSKGAQMIQGLLSKTLKLFGRKITLSPIFEGPTKVI